MSLEFPLITVGQSIWTTEKKKRKKEKNDAEIGNTPWHQDDEFS